MLESPGTGGQLETPNTLCSKMEGAGDWYSVGVVLMGPEFFTPFPFEGAAGRQMARAPRERMF